MPHFLPIRLPCLLLISCVFFAPSTIRAEADVFRAFTAHISHQVEADKQTFVFAQVCTTWFYEELRQKPPRPRVDGMAFHTNRNDPHAADAARCRLRYPDGLETARKDFTHSQSSLSVSLTFYEFALVGDRNDDGRYDETELRDMLESFGLPYSGALPPSAHLAALNAQFEQIRGTVGLDVLMTGMGILYDRGYRFTMEDRAALNRLAG